ncbi:MAG TPA: serine/threonine-protein kinase, partial [Thermoanaerobaculia bacterium]
MTLEAGRRVGAYEILSPLGAGGMGEVYRARDTRLGREVAIKVLPEELAGDRRRLERFEQEARAASALNHPNIVTIHEVGVEGERPFLAMELVEGKSLRELILEPMPVRRLLGIATQVAEGLAKAHSVGIVHRDLKPENVMVSKDGFVKVLDFGLAKLTEPDSGQLSGMPTVVSTRTGPGVVLGTVSYMSPEQASGEKVDYRSDQFSLGAMLYEMATGRRAFQRKTSAETMSAVIREEPEPAGKIRPELPAPVRWILDRCLAKDPEERYASTRDLARELASVRDYISEVSSGAEVPISGQAAPSRRLRRVAAALFFAAAGATVAWLLARGRPAAAGPPTFQRLTFQKLVIANARFAPDGTTVLYGATINGQDGLYEARVGSPESQLVPIGAADILAISSGGEMAVRLGRGPAGTLAKMPLLGGAPRPVAENIVWAGADWTPDGKDLAVVRRFEGKDRLEFPIGNILVSEGAGCPRFSPRGDWIAFTEGDHVAIIRPDGKDKRALSSDSLWATCPLAWRP